MSNFKNYVSERWDCDYFYQQKFLFSKLANKKYKQ